MHFSIFNNKGLDFLSEIWPFMIFIWIHVNIVNSQYIWINIVLGPFKSNNTSMLTRLWCQGGQLVSKMRQTDWVLYPWKHENNQSVNSRTFYRELQTMVHVPLGLPIYHRFKVLKYRYNLGLHPPHFIRHWNRLCIY